MSAPRREPEIAVTGVGVVSPIGFGREQFWSALQAGRSGIGPLESLSLAPPLPSIAAEVRGFAAREFIASANLRRMGKLARMIVAAARMALDDARLPPGQLAPERLGVVIGSAIGELSASQTYLDKVFAKGPAAASPLLFPNLVHNAPASYVSLELSATGVILTLAQGEGSGEEAILQACETLRAGRADAVLAGGGDEIAPIVFEAAHRAGELSGRDGGQVRCAPYDRRRSGIVIGEGAAVVLLESLEQAQRRGAVPLAVIEGGTSFAVPSSPYDWPSDASNAIEPLQRLGGGGVDLIVGGGNGSRRLDPCELALFARLAPEAWVTSIKGAIGEHGSAGALSFAAACLALREQAVPPLPSLVESIAPAVRLAGKVGVGAKLGRALVVGLARGGTGAGLLLRRPL